MPVVFPVEVLTGIEPTFDNRGLQPGPFINSQGNLFIVEPSASGNIFSGTSTIHMFRSTDQGDTYTEIDSGNAKTAFTWTIGVWSVQQMVNAVLVNDVVYVVYWNGSDELAVLTIAAFDTISGLWEAEILSTLTFQRLQDGGVYLERNNGARTWIVYRPSDQTIVILANAGEQYRSASVDSFQRLFWTSYAILGGWDSSWHTVGPTGVLAISVFTGSVCIDGDGLIHFWYCTAPSNIDPPNAFFHITLNGTTLSSPQSVTADQYPLLPGPSTGFIPVIVNGTEILFPTVDSLTGQTLSVVRGTAGETPVWASEEVFTSLDIIPAAALTVDSGTLVITYAEGSGPSTMSFRTFDVAWSDATLLGTLDIGVIFGALFSLSGSTLLVFQFSAVGGISVGTWIFTVAPSPPGSPAPSKPRGGGGVYFPRSINRTFLLASLYRALAPINPDVAPFFSPFQTPDPPLSSFFLGPNLFDLCLMRDIELYNLIGREEKSCAKKPDCFLQDERSWNDAPSGFITFNPVGAIPLPDPALENVVIFSFRVPLGFDGMILGQFHGATFSFTEGIGDLVWRVRISGRYGRDMGNMLMQIGSNITLSPVSGGLQLRSGNLVEYLISAPNGSGTLPLPGQGNILAGLHGYFYPRGKSGANA